MAYAIGLNPLAKGGMMATEALTMPQGIASSDVTTNSAIIWSRANKQSMMLLAYSKNEDLSEAKSMMAAAMPNTDYTVQVKLSELEGPTTAACCCATRS